MEVKFSDGSVQNFEGLNSFLANVIEAGGGLPAESIVEPVLAAPEFTPDRVAALIPRNTVRASDQLAP